MAKKITIKKDPENEIPVEIFEQAIVDISTGFSKFENSRLTKRAIILLVQDAAGSQRVSRQQVQDVLEAAAALAKTYLK